MSDLNIGNFAETILEIKDESTQFKGAHAYLDECEVPKGPLKSRLILLMKCLYSKLWEYEDWEFRGSWQFYRLN